MMFLGLVIGFILGAGFILWFLGPRLEMQEDSRDLRMINNGLLKALAELRTRCEALEARTQQQQLNDSHDADWWKKMD